MLSGVPEPGCGARYREFMMSASAGFHGAQPVGASPREIRAALVGEEAGHFDREYRQAMADAAESLDLSGVLAMLERWRPVAWSSRDDPQAHRAMLENADRLSAGENIATVPWHQVKARLGLVTVLQVAPWSGDAYDRQRPDANMRPVAR